ncbi:hypothetical protein Poly24_01200 [Rosistilla carotiformis]|uniref:Secreted protein n=1 Tax=Rosistilla carotiformis TaxID=2528017 RepID=A0A518JLM9_9BACT|nr:hypothetical protein [Rosistilla carotiformis]QDV66434.1 hypothetical protein Poly24_01200 [Rosistilla carotiformis]
MLTHVKKLALAALAIGMVSQFAISEAEAGYGGRQYYSSWSYQPTRSYHYTRYYYKPVVSAPTYSYHYCISYPSQPRYVYYYNPRSQQYWGRYDLEGTEGAQYSLLAEKDRKKNLEDIPESAFPAPAAMPAIPDSKDGIAIEPIKDKPGDEPKDLPYTK